MLLKDSNNLTNHHKPSNNPNKAGSNSNSDSNSGDVRESNGSDDGSVVTDAYTEVSDSSTNYSWVSAPNTLGVGTNGSSAGQRGPLKGPVIGLKKR